MTKPVERAAEWIYGETWAWLVKWFRVPREPPTLPVLEGETVESFRPAPGFLAYLKLWFWLALFPIDGIIVVAWIAIAAAAWWLGALLVVPALFIAVLPDIVAYIALHLRYDTTWYVMTDRSLRIRRGIWNIHEVTITFENVQNVSVAQGPVQRFFGIADVIVETAGGGAAPGQVGQTITNRGVIEGIANAAGIRDRILVRLRHSRTAGLGDEEEETKERRGAPGASGPAWTPEHIAVLAEIRDALRSLAVGA